MGNPIFKRAFFWICSDCAAAQGSHVPEGHLPTWHEDQCDWCLQPKTVTEPRDFRPRPKELKTPK